MKHPIPDDALDSDIAIIARKGSGKSYLARGLAERLLDLKRRMVVIDPLGAWWGLKASADGQHEGYPVAVFGGEHADMPLTEQMGEPLAKLIAGENLPCVLDTSEMRKDEQGKFAIDFFENLFRFNKDALTIILEESDVFAPQNPAKDGYAAKVLHEVDRIARRGRARGLRLITLTQRPARLHKDVLSQAATLIAMRLTSPHDQAAIEDWIKGNADSSQAKVVMDSLATLPVGTGWVWAPDLSMLEKVAFPKIKTLDTSATPKAGETRVAPKTLAQVDVSAIREALKVPSPEPKPASKGPKPTIEDPKATSELLAAAEQRGFDRGFAVGYGRGAAEKANELGKLVLQFSADFALKAATSEAAPAPRLAPRPPSGPTPAAELTKAPQRPPAAPRAGVAGDLAQNPFYQAALSVHPVRMTWSQLGVLAQRKTHGGSFNTAKKRLLAEDYLVEVGDLVAVAHPGDIALGTVPADLLEQRLPTVPAEMFKAIRRTPGLTVQDLAEQLGKVPRGGSWNTGMSILTKNDIIIADQIGGLHINASLLEDA